MLIRAPDELEIRKLAPSWIIMAPIIVYYASTDAACKFSVAELAGICFFISKLFISPGWIDAPDELEMNQFGSLNVTLKESTDSPVEI